MTNQQIFEWERHEYESTLARTVYRSFHEFTEALHRELAVLSDETDVSVGNPRTPVPGPRTTTGRSCAPAPAASSNP